MLRDLSVQVAGETIATLATCSELPMLLLPAPEPMLLLPAPASKPKEEEKPIIPFLLIHDELGFYMQSMNDYTCGLKNIHEEDLIFKDSKVFIKNVLRERLKKISGFRNRSQAEQETIATIIQDQCWFSMQEAVFQHQVKPKSFEIMERAGLFCVSCRELLEIPGLFSSMDDAKMAFVGILQGIAVTGTHHCAEQAERPHISINVQEFVLAKDLLPTSLQAPFIDTSMLAEKLPESSGLVFDKYKTGITNEFIQALEKQLSPLNEKANLIDLTGIEFDFNDIKKFSGICKELSVINDKFKHYCNENSDKLPAILDALPIEMINSSSLSHPRNTMSEQDGDDRRNSMLRHRLNSRSIMFLNSRYIISGNEHSDLIDPLLLKSLRSMADSIHFNNLSHKSRINHVFLIASLMLNGQKFNEAALNSYHFLKFKDSFDSIVSTQNDFHKILIEYAECNKFQAEVSHDHFNFNASKHLKTRKMYYSFSGFNSF